MLDADAKAYCKGYGYERLVLDTAAEREAVAGFFAQVHPASMFAQPRFAGIVLGLLGVSVADLAYIGGVSDGAVCAVWLVLEGTAARYYCHTPNFVVCERGP